VPAHPVARALLEATALPVAAPSANPAGGVSPTTADHVAEGLGAAVDILLDGGSCRIGLESTVLDLSAGVPRLLRPGGVTRSALEAEIGPLAAGPADPGQAPRAPGQLASHYAPARPLRLEARSVAADEALLAFGPRPLAGARATLNLSATGDLAEAAANLFAMLRCLDRPDVRAIAVMPIPAGGLGEAIRDRLERAAAPRAGERSGACSRDFA
jgi:L-threonylcarbamoyladenylate synthase